MSRKVSLIIVNIQIIVIGMLINELGYIIWHCQKIPEL